MTLSLYCSVISWEVFTYKSKLASNLSGHTNVWKNGTSCLPVWHYRVVQGWTWRSPNDSPAAPLLPTALSEDDGSNAETTCTSFCIMTFSGTFVWSPGSLVIQWRSTVSIKFEDVYYCIRIVYWKNTNLISINLFLSWSIVHGKKKRKHCAITFCKGLTNYTNAYMLPQV